MSYELSLFFSFTGVYLKYVSQQLIAPNLRSLKMGAISCHQKYLTLISFCLFAGWGEHHGKQGRFQVGAQEKWRVSR
jgi:hypothetical protein